MTPADLPDLRAVHLPDLRSWLPTQRWFSGKDRPIADTGVVDALLISPSRHVWLAAVEVTYDDDGPSERWLLVLTGVAAGTADAIGEVDGMPVVELATAPQSALELLAAIRRGGQLVTAQGGHATALHVASAPPPTPTVRPMGAEQSNSSLVVGDRGSGSAVVVKVIRRLEAGPNPDVEVTAALTRGGFAGVPPMLGAITGPQDEALVTASRFVTGGRDASDLAVEEAAGIADHGMAGRMHALGALTADMHARLRTVLPTTDARPTDSRGWRQALQREGARTAEVLAARRPGAEPSVSRAVESALADAPDDLGLLQRIHGDYHLGQVLLHPDGTWWILDFEGEPARPVSERRAPANPAKDVAGMLRSLDYARARAVMAGGQPQTARAWADRAREGFLSGYAQFSPAGGNNPVWGWLRAFEVEKLLYEIRYEAANRPDWLDIPLTALTDDAPHDRSHDDSDDSERTVDDTNPSPTPEPDPMPDPTPDPTRGSTPGPTGPSEDPVPTAGALLADGRLHEPHSLLGYHADGEGWVVRAWRPGAEAVAYLATPDADPLDGDERLPGLFEVRVAEEPEPGTYRLRVVYPDGGTYDLVDPYSFPPVLGEVDQHLLTEGRHEQAWDVMGANRRVLHGIDGVGFAVWAPNARSVRLIGDFNSWDGRLHPMRSVGSSGIWELFVPDVPDGAYYKYEIVTAEDQLVTRADPWAKYSDIPPGTASRVFTSTYQPQHADGARRDPHDAPVSTYEVHLASWRHRDGRSLSYAEMGHELAEHVTRLGFTHVEFLPPAEHPFGGSWGYQVTGQFAPTSRFGDPDEFRRMVDALHARGIGVIVDWVPAHFPKDEWALARFDGTALYEHEDPRQGEHPDWGTLVFNFGRREVRNFLVASALFWLEDIGVDGLRVDAVASMLYLDYSREEGEWLPNEHGGRENLEAVDFLQEVNATVYKRNPDAFTIAEESTAWPGVSRPTHLGGLGFGFKWNMGWMHDTLAYFQRDPIYRRWHHNQLTFGLMYAFSENFVLPLSHDEVVHGKGSLLGKMPGDRWQKFANLRALYGWMWGHPGKKLLFMGQEFGQEREWSEERELDWWLLDDRDHAGLMAMVADANRVYQELPALWRRDADHTGFGWIDANNADDNLLSFLRFGAEGEAPVAVIANLSPSPQHDVRFGLPTTGHWSEVLNTDAAAYGGGNVGNLGGVEATDQPWHGQPASAEITCPPLGVVWLQGPIEGEADDTA